MARLNATTILATIRRHIGNSDTTEVSGAAILSMYNEVMAEVVLEYQPAEARYDHSISVTTGTGAGPYNLYAGTFRTYDGRNSTTGERLKEIDEARYNILKASTTTGDAKYYLRLGTTAANPTVHTIYVWPTPSRANTIIIPSLVMPTELTTTGTPNSVQLNRAFDTVIQDIAIVRLLTGDRQYEAAQAYKELVELDRRRAILAKRTAPRSTAPGKVYTRLKGLFR